MVVLMTVCLHSLVPMNWKATTCIGNLKKKTILSWTK
jgi:hypothetical protein